jgi:anaerobic magnesium-protoporphyrin IX monomethyl ester cyclase
MNVLLIYPPIEHQAIYSRGFRRVKGAETMTYPPLGLMYLQAIIKRETPHHVMLLDLSLPEKASFDLAGFVQGFCPDIVGMTAYTLCFYDVLSTAKRIKAIRPATKVVLGGPHIALFPGETLLHPEIDFAISGDGERPLLELIKVLAEGHGALSGIPSLHYRDATGQILMNGPAHIEKDLDSLPFPCRDDLDEQRYHSPFFAERGSATISTSRGCPFDCTFCDVTDKVFRARSVGSVIAEVEHLVNEHGIRSFFILDDLFNITEQRVLDFCDRILEKKLRIRWVFRGRVDRMSEAVAAKCAEAGCVHVIFGIEDFSDEGLKLIRKRISLARTVEAFQMIRHAGIKTTANFIIGFPHHKSEADILKINDFIKRLRPDWVQLGILIPFPGSRLFSDGVAAGIIDGGRWPAYIKNPTPVFELPLWEERLSLEQLTSLYERIMKRFYFAPENLLKRLMEIRSLHQFATYCKIGLATLRMGRRTAVPLEGPLR